MNIKTFTMLALSVALASAHAQDVTIERSSGSDFDANTLLIAPSVRASVREPDKTSTSLRVLKPKNGAAPAWILLLMTEYSDFRWRHYTSVSLVGGVVLPAKKIKSQVQGCSSGGLCRYLEWLSVDLPAAAVDLGHVSGIRLRWNAESIMGPFEVEIPASHFTAMADALKR